MKEYSGKVVRAPFGEGSRSAHEGIWLVAPEGRYLLRRRDGNAFRDEVLEGLEGKQIRCRGILTDYLLLLDQWEIVP